MNKQNIDTIAVIDYGSQYTQLIARRIRELNIYSEIFKHDISINQLRKKMFQESFYLEVHQAFMIKMHLV